MLLNSHRFGVSSPATPVIKEYGAYAGVGSVTSLAIPYTAAAGDLIVLQIGNRTVSSTPGTLSGSGWTLVDGAPKANGNHKQYLYWKVASGVESGDTYTAPGSSKILATVHVIEAGSHGGSIESAYTSTTANSATISLTASWGGAENLFVYDCFVGSYSAPMALFRLPDNNAEAQSEAIVTSSGSTIATASQVVASDSLTTQVMTNSGSSSVVRLSRLIAIKPNT